MNRWKVEMARKRLINKKKQELIKDIKVGDLVKYCPNDLDEFYHDYGVIIQIEELYEIKSINKKIYEFKIIWQKEKRTVTYTSNNLIECISKKSMILCK